jgi:hypothetical protein
MNPSFDKRIRKVCALVSATLILPAVAYADPGGVPAEIAALQAQVTALRNQVNTLLSNNGLAYLITITDAQGAFASRGVLTFHADHTMSAIDSGQGGPTSFFTSQLGSWKSGNAGSLLARTIDFDFPPTAAVARLDYTVNFSSDRTQVTGTIALRTFPLLGNPLDGDGTVVGEFTFTGTLVTP